MLQILRCRAVLTVVDDFAQGQREIIVELDGGHPAVHPLLEAKQAQDDVAVAKETGNEFIT